MPPAQHHSGVEHVADCLQRFGNACRAHRTVAEAEGAADHRAFSAMRNLLEQILPEANPAIHPNSILSPTASTIGGGALIDDAALMFSLGVRSIINVPVEWRGACLGVLNFACPHSLVKAEQVAAARLLGLVSVAALKT